MPPLNEEEYDSVTAAALLVCAEMKVGSQRVDDIGKAASAAQPLPSTGEELPF